MGTVWHFYRAAPIAEPRSRVRNRRLESKNTILATDSEKTFNNF